MILNIQSATSSIKLKRPACVCRLCCVRHLPVVSVTGSSQSPQLSEHEAESPVGRWSGGHVCGALACPGMAHTRVHLLVLNILQPRHRDSNITIHCHKLHSYDNLIDDHFGVYYETLSLNSNSHNINIKKNIQYQSFWSFNSIFNCFSILEDLLS